jgi:colicin import membrane protein
MVNNMARAGITFEQVVQSAEALVGKGQQPTIRAIRERLGDTGSPNTIHKHLTAWREARPATAASARELPQALTAAICAEIERAASQARADIEGRLTQSLAEAAELAGAGELLEAERDMLAEQVAVLTSERDTLVGKASQQAVDRVEQAQRIAREQKAAEAARVELAKTQLKVEAQSEAVVVQAAEIERLRVTLETQSKARIQSDQQTAVLAAKLEAMSDRATKAEVRVELIEQQTLQAAEVARVELAKSHALVNQATKELSNARLQIQAQQGALDTAVREIASAKNAATEARADAKKAGEEAAFLGGRLDAVLTQSVQRCTAK